VEALGDFLDMGGYAPFVWGAYGFCAVVLIAMLVQSWRRLRANEATLRRIEAARPRRRRAGSWEASLEAAADDA
jgi:heme exporter protein D